jgi:hypothetical protein
MKHPPLLPPPLTFSSSLSVSPSSLSPPLSITDRRLFDKADDFHSSLTFGLQQWFCFIKPDHAIWQAEAFTPPLFQRFNALTL